MADGILGAEATGGVGQDRQLVQIEKVENIAAAGVDEPFAADRHSGDFAGARLHALVHEFVCRVFAGAGEKPRGEGELADPEWRFGAAADERDNLDGVTSLERHVVMFSSLLSATTIGALTLCHTGPRQARFFLRGG